MIRLLFQLVLAALTVPTCSLHAKALNITEALIPSNWTSPIAGAKAGKPLFLSDARFSGTGLPVQLPVNERPSWISLSVTNGNWAGYASLSLQTYNEEAFETPLDLALEDESGHRSVIGKMLPLGAPGWNICTLSLANSGVNLARVRKLSIGLDAPRGLISDSKKLGHFYISALTVEKSTASPSTESKPNVAIDESATVRWRTELARLFPQSLPVSHFRIITDTNRLARRMLNLTDDVLFDSEIRSNWVAKIEADAGALRSQTNLVGISYNISVPLITTVSPSKTEDFQGWLAKAYPTIGDLNSRWGRDYSGFEKVDWPQSASISRDAVSFWQQRVTEAVRDAMLAARRGAPRAYLASHLQRLHGTAWQERPLNYYTLQREVPWSHYSLGEIPTGGGDSRQFLSDAETRSLVSTLAVRINRRLWASTFNPTAPEGQWLSGPASRWQETVAARNLWMRLAASEDGATPQNDSALLEKPLRRAAPLWPVFAAVRPVSRLGIISSSSSRLLNNDTENEERAWFELMWSAGYQPAVVFEETSKDYPKTLNDYAVLALGSATHLPSYLQDALVEWVRNGGTLLCSGPAGLYDPWGRRLARLTWELLGVDEAKQTNDRWQIDIHKLKQGAEVAATDDQGAPLAVRATYGRGEIVMSLAPAASHKTLRDIWRAKLLERVKREIESSEPNLYLDWRPTEDRRAFLAVAINLSPYTPIKAQVKVNAMLNRITNLCEQDGAEKVTRELADEITFFSLQLAPGEGTVLLLEKSKAGRSR